jgi:hypothetical protein
VLKHYAPHRKRRLSALPNVGPYVYNVKIYDLTYIYIYIYILDISRLRVKEVQPMEDKRGSPYCN